MKKLIILTATALALILFSCGKNKEQNNTTHNAQNSLDYAGTYVGIIPCADCSGIEIELTIDYDNSYVKKAIYQDEAPDNLFVTEGSFEWNEAGNTITLLAEDSPEKYRIEENKIWLLDIEGNKITGDLADNYMLSKSEVLNGEK